jgi:hypothetical protein
MQYSSNKKMINLGTTQVSLRLKLLLFFGHGRLLELYLVCLKMMVGINVSTVQRYVTDETPAALWDLFWHIPPLTIAAPFFCVGTVQLLGLVLNYRGLEISWIPRFVGAVLGTTLWFWLIYKSIAVGELHTWLFSLACVTVCFSAFIAWKAWNRLPIPGIIVTT